MLSLDLTGLLFGAHAFTWQQPTQSQCPQIIQCATDDELLFPRHTGISVIAVNSLVYFCVKHFNGSHPVMKRVDLRSEM